MIPISTTEQALEIGKCATLEDIRAFAKSRRECLELCESARKAARDATDEERKRFFLIASDFATKAQLFREATLSYLDRIRN